jgi:hypothetical protein
VWLRVQGRRASGGAAGFFTRYRSNPNAVRDRGYRRRLAQSGHQNASSTLIVDEPLGLSASYNRDGTGI